MELMKLLPALVGATALALCSGARAGAPVGCLIEPERVAEVGSPVVGVIDAVRVDRGDKVSAGQPLAVLRADVERANLDVAESRAHLEADVGAATANLVLARQRLERAQQLHAVNFVSRQALEQANAEHEIAAQRLAQAKEHAQVLARELGVAQAQLRLRTLRSPFHGVVVDRFMNPGERVEEKPLLRIAMIDPLRVEVMLPVAHYGSIAAGASLTVYPDLPNAEPVSARVTRVDKVIDAASNTFRVRLSLPNPGHKLPAGLRCRVDLPNAPERVAGKIMPVPGKAAPVTTSGAAARVATPGAAARVATAPGTAARSAQR
ncbi:MAG: efflux RND transporter periplasmic adaptor subunit [Burkholderiales bacterium]